MPYPKPITRLISIFTKFPGIGPRQATRFAFFILNASQELTQELASALREVGEKISWCGQCFSSMEKEMHAETRCVLCRDAKRDSRLIAIVERESDMQNLEKTGAFHGAYHVLNGVVSPLDPESPKRLHLRELFNRIKLLVEHDAAKIEIILATNSTTEGDTTALYIERILAPLKEKYPQIAISRLGRGLSLGAELEYADEITLKNALTNRR